MSEEKFDCIVVGAGPAGSAAAYKLAQNGLNVVLIEKGEVPGCKNMMGGRLYTHSLRQLIPDFEEEAPLERHVTKEIITMMSGQKAMNLQFHDAEEKEEPPLSYVVLRADFDQWLAGKAEEEGAFLAAGVRVDELIWENNRVIGIRSDEDELLADVVILADGVNSLLAKKANLRKKLAPNHLSVGAKAVIELPSGVIEDRFGLNPGEGAAQMFVGEATKGIQGGGFLYTNNESISLGLVVNLESLGKAKISVADLVEDFRLHPCVRPLIEGGEIVEYSGHLVPEAGLGMVPQLYADGLLVTGDAAGFVINTGFMVRGMDLAITSGMLAADTVLKAKEKENYSKETLAEYETWLKSSHVFADLNAYKNTPHFMEEATSMYTVYPAMVLDILTKLFRADGTPPQPVRDIMKETVKEHTSLWQLIKDGLRGYKAV